MPPNMDERPIVSVGVPTWNRPVDLRRCLDQLVRQSYASLEIIVSDNCSDLPEVRQVLDEFSRRDARVRFVVQPQNVGPLHNFQFLLEQARGEFFMWAGDDDYRDPLYVESLLAALRAQPDALLAFCDFVEVDAQGCDISGRRHLAQLRPFTRAHPVARLVPFFFQREHLGKANLIYGLIRREALSGFDWPRFVARHHGWGADMLFVFWLLKRGPLALAPQLLYRCTVGNPKWHAEGNPMAWRDAVRSRIQLVGHQVRYSVQYVGLAEGGIRLVMGALWPLRVVDIVMRLVFLAAARWIMRKIRSSLSL